MIVKLSSIKIDPIREDKGDWVDFPDWPGVKFKVSPFTKPAYQAARGNVYRRLNKQHNNGVVPDEEARPAAARLYVDHILHDWSGFDEPYSEELAYNLLSSLEGRKLVDAVEWCAAQAARTEIEFVEQETKNSEPSSDKVSKGEAVTATG